jgi:hypothetical protein
VVIFQNWVSQFTHSLAINLGPLDTISKIFENVEDYKCRNLIEWLIFGKFDCRQKHITIFKKCFKIVPKTFSSASLIFCALHNQFFLDFRILKRLLRCFFTLNSFLDVQSLIQVQQETIQKSNEKPTVSTQGQNYSKVTLHTKTFPTMPIMWRLVGGNPVFWIFAFYFLLMKYSRFRTFYTYKTSITEKKIRLSRRCLDEIWGAANGNKVMVRI